MISLLFWWVLFGGGGVHSKLFITGQIAVTTEEMHVNVVLFFFFFWISQKRFEVIVYIVEYRTLGKFPDTF